MGTLTHLSTPAMSSISPMSLQPLVQVVGQSTDPFVGEDILQDGGIRYVIRRHLVDHQEGEDYNFTDLFDSKETTGDVTVICTNKSADRELFLVKAHKQVLVKSCSFFQRYFEPFPENQSLPTLIMPNIHASTMDQWLQLFYTNQVILKFDEMVSFWSAAEILKVDHVEPVYNWVYYIETLQPVTSENSPDPTTTHFETLLPFHVATGNGMSSSLIDGQTVTRHYQQATAVIQQVVPVTVSMSQKSSQQQPIFILRELHSSSPVPVPNITTHAGDPLSPVIIFSDNQQVHSTGHPNMAAPPSSPTAGDIAMAMLSNPEQRCRFVYDISPEREEQQAVISPPPPQVSPRPFLIPQIQDRAMVMCPACLLVVNSESFADHKLICSEYKEYSSAIPIPIPPLAPSLSPPNQQSPTPPRPPSASSPQKVFPCSVCGKAFVTIKGLKAHLPVHKKFNKASKPPTSISIQQSDSSPTSAVPQKMKKPCISILNFKKGHPPVEKHRPVPSSTLSSPPDPHQ